MARRQGHVWRTGAGAEVRVGGKLAMTLERLVDRGALGVEVFDFPGGQAFRLSGYVHKLRARGLDIATHRSPHEGGWHARYELLTPLVSA